MFDVVFILAIGALGWGLSLATYRAFATRHRWPMGAWQSRSPELPIVVGAVCALMALWIASGRIAGENGSGWLIVLFGLAWAVFWTGFLRVGAQSALILAPAAALILLLLKLT